MKLTLGPKTHFVVNMFNLPEGATITLDDQGQLHSFKDEPAIVWPKGTKEWWKHGVKHRENGPACLGSNGLEKWYLNGHEHRDGGPAIVHPEGRKEWFYLGARLIVNDKVITDYGFMKSKKFQDFVCRNRPDLISQIPNLDPDLKAKYRHELGLNATDI